MTEREFDVLSRLDDTLWQRPMDVGGSDGSHHSTTLARLARSGLAERKKIHSLACINGSTERKKLVGNRWVYSNGHPPHEGCTCKGSCRYRRTAAGRSAAVGARPADQLRGAP